MAKHRPSKLLARNTGLNLVGLGAPSLVAILAIPVLLTGLGTERFGVLTISWMAIGYFNVFDMGLGRALTQRVAAELGAGREKSVGPIFWTAIPLMVAMGVVGMALVGSLAHWLVDSLFAIPEPLVPESRRAFQILALSLPWVIATAGLRGFLEARQCFGMINAVRVPTGIFNFVGPLLVLPFSHSLVPIIAVLTVGRVVGCIVHLALCFRAMPSLAGGIRFHRDELMPLLRFGGWMTVSNLISPFMVYFDRFFIGAMVSMTAVAYYVTPYEVVTRLFLIPAALYGVLFPAMAETSNGRSARTIHLLDGGVRATFIVLFPIVLVLVALAPEALALWLGPDFASNSAAVLQLLAIGVLVNSVAQLEFSAVQAVGHPELTGKLHLIELPLYLLTLWWAVSAFGIVGAAIAWTLRVTLDTGMLMLFVRRLVPGARGAIRRTVVALGTAMTILTLATVPTTLVAKLLYISLVLTGAGIVSWRAMLSEPERLILLQRVRQLAGRAEPEIPTVPPPGR